MISQDELQFVIESLKIGLDCARECLGEHDIRFGRNTTANAVNAGHILYVTRH